ASSPAGVAIVSADLPPIVADGGIVTTVVPLSSSPAPASSLLSVPLASHVALDAAAVGAEAEAETEDLLADLSIITDLVPVPRSSLSTAAQRPRSSALAAPSTSPSLTPSLSATTRVSASPSSPLSV